jgi:iron-only hydrogenase group A
MREPEHGKKESEREKEELGHEEKWRREVTRRTFLKLFGLAGAATLGGGLLVKPMSMSVGIVGTAWAGTLPLGGRVPIYACNPALTLDEELCDFCGGDCSQCVVTCYNQHVLGYYKDATEAICIHCGQCSLVCAIGAIQEREHIAQVETWLADPAKHVVVQTAPATRVALGEEFGQPPGTWMAGEQVTALRQLGFDAVLDTNFTADVTVIEEVAELDNRIKGVYPKPLPMITTCSPGWIKFGEYFYPEQFPHFSTCKSPQQMFGALVKTYYAEQKALAAADIVSVAIMPCTAKKFEAQRPEMNDSGFQDVDAVLTTRELAKLLKKNGIDPSTLPAGSYDSLMGESTGGATIFGATGGVMEAAVRTLHFVNTNTPPPPEFLNLTAVRGQTGVKEATVNISGIGDVKVVVAHGLNNARWVMDQVAAGTAPWHFIELMGCPSGCSGGGGQPKTTVPPTAETYQKRMDAMYEADAGMVKRESYENAEVAALYTNFLGNPLSTKSYQLLHTDYVSRAAALTRLSTQTDMCVTCQRPGC